MVSVAFPNRFIQHLGYRKAQITANRLFDFVLELNTLISKEISAHDASG